MPDPETRIDASEILNGTDEDKALVSFSTNWPHLPLRLLCSLLAVGVLVIALLFLPLEPVLGAMVTGDASRLINLWRAPLATIAGMVLVWLIMRIRESEISRLRDDFSRQLASNKTALEAALWSLRQESQRLNATLDSMAEGVLEIDPDGHVSVVNRSAAEILQMESSELSNTKIETLVERMKPTDNASLDCNDLFLPASRRLEHPVCGECVFIPASGLPVYLAWTASPLLLEGEIRGTVVTLSDVTERVILERQLAEQRNDFISALRHKLHTPVLASSRVIRLLREGAFGAVSVEQKQILALLDEGESKLLALIDTLVELYRYQNGIKELRIRPHSLKEIIDNALRDGAAKLVRTGVTATLDGMTTDCRVACDKKELVRLLSHLVENGLRHAKSSVSVTVELKSSSVELLVQDDGPGVAPEDVVRLFDRFFEVSSHGTHPPTTGTGLCLCREIARAHGGTLSYDARPGEGARFKLSLPRADQDSRQGSPA